MSPMVTITWDKPTAAQLGTWVTSTSVFLSLLPLLGVGRTL